MSSLFGKTILFLALVAATAALGYTAWEVRDLKMAAARTAQGNETNVTEMMIALAQTEGQLARVREAVELLGAGGPTEAPDETALEGKLTAALSVAHREVLQQELQKWAQQLQDQRDKSLAAVRESLEQEVGRRLEQGNRQLFALVEENQGTLTKQLKDLGASLARPSEGGAPQGQSLANLEERLAALVETVNSQGEALAQRNERDDQRWEELFLALQESREATLRRYAEVAARLEPNDPPTPVDTTEPGQPAQESGAPDGVLTERERLDAFCAEVPQSALCRDL